jgi:two-component system nitrate/nitrite sensor histidine kinase NarX
MKYNRISVKMGMIFTVFALLVLVSVGITFWGLNEQKVDAVVINLAGRQRMLVQQMTRLALEIQDQGLGDYVDLLQESQLTFGQTLVALKDGGPAPYIAGSTVELPKTKDAQILSQIEVVERSWIAYREQLGIIQTAPPSSQAFNQALQTIEETAPTLVEQMDTTVRLYETQSTAEVNALRMVQVIFLSSALGLLILGVWITRHFVIRPLQALGSAAQGIGAGNLEAPVVVNGDVEIELLSDSLEEMRSKLLVSQQELLNWTNVLEERVAQRTHELEALNAVSREVVSRLDIQHVLNSIVDKSRQLLSADVAFLCLLNEERNLLSLQANSGTPEAVAACTTPAGSAWTSQVIGSEQAVRCEVDDCKGFCQIVTGAFRQSHLAAQISIDHHVIGALCVGSQRPDYFAEEAINLLTQLATIASIAIENARLYTQVERSSAIEERHRIAAEMHDGLAQTMSYLTITAEQAQEQLEKGNFVYARESLARMQKGVDQASIDIRRAIASLHEEFPSQYTLQEQLRSLVDELCGSTLKAEWDNQIHIPLILDQPETEQVLRVVREALINAQKHSQATRVSVILKRSNDTTIVSIEDDGVGFDPQELPQDDRPHFGLKIMQARAARIGGNIEIDSLPGKGTRIVLAWQQEKIQNNG